MNRQTLPGMIRDLLTTGDQDSRRESVEWLTGIINLYAPADSQIQPRPPWSADAAVIEASMTGHGGLTPSMPTCPECGSSDLYVAPLPHSITPPEFAWCRFCERCLPDRFITLILACLAPPLKGK